MSLTKYVINRNGIHSYLYSYMVTHQQFASDLNASREAVSRLLKKMEKMGDLILGRNKIEILDLWV